MTYNAICLSVSIKLCEMHMRNQVLTWNTIINYVMHMSCKSIENENLNAW